MSHPDFADYFSDDSTQYRAFRPLYPAGLYEYLASIVPARDLAWDAGTGNGQVALDLAKRFARVLATDASAEQLAAAPAHPRVEYRVTLSEDGGPEDHSCDLVTVGQALHWFDPQRFFTTARRVLRPGGIIAIWCYSGVRVSPGVDALVARFTRESVGGFWPPERARVDDGYAGVAFPFLERNDVPDLDLTTSWTARQFLGYLGTWSATRRFQQAHGFDPVAPMREALLQAWGAGALPVRWPLHLRVGGV